MVKLYLCLLLIFWIGSESHVDASWDEFNLDHGHGYQPSNSEDYSESNSENQINSQETYNEDEDIPAGKEINEDELLSQDQVQQQKQQPPPPPPQQQQKQQQQQPPQQKQQPPQQQKQKQQQQQQQKQQQNVQQQKKSPPPSQSKQAPKKSKSPAKPSKQAKPAPKKAKAPKKAVKVAKKKKAAPKTTVKKASPKKAAAKPKKKAAAPAKKVPTKKAAAKPKKTAAKPKKKAAAPKKKTATKKKPAAKSAKKSGKKVKASDLGLASLQVLMALFVILASGILGVNGLILWSAYANDGQDKFKFNILKTTLAVLDMCNGIYIFAVVVPNLFWTIQHVTKKISIHMLTAPSTSNTTALGIIYMLVFLSYLYTLTFLGILRYKSIKAPDQIAETPCNHIRLMVVLIIVVSLVVSTVPAWFPKSFTFDYQHNIFSFWVESIGESTLVDSVALVLLLLIIIPYTSLIGTMIASCYLTKKKAELITNDHEILEQECDMTKTVASMITGFIVTTAPFLIVSFLLVGGAVSFEVIHVAHTATFFVFCCRSLVNIIAYMCSNIPQAGAIRETVSPGSSKRSSSSSSGGSGRVSLSGSGSCSTTQQEVVEE